MDWKNGFERLAEINPQYRTQNWHWDIVKDSDAIKNKSYYNSWQTFEIENFDPTLVVGTCHLDYKNITWIEMLEKLKRYKSSEVDTIESLQSHINDTRSTGLNKYGDEFYINSGNHRFCIAKLSGQKVKRAQVTEYLFDHERFRVDSWFESKNIQLLPQDSERSCVEIYMLDTFLTIERILLEDFMNTYEMFETSTWERIKFTLSSERAKRKSIKNVENLKTPEIKKLIWEHKVTNMYQTKN